MRRARPEEQALARSDGEEFDEAAYAAMEAQEARRAGRRRLFWLILLGLTVVTYLYLTITGL